MEQVTPSLALFGAQEGALAVRREHTLPWTVFLQEITTPKKQPQRKMQFVQRCSHSAVYHSADRAEEFPGINEGYGLGVGALPQEVQHAR